ncbi:type II secretion system F family protein [Chitinilyticum litopenaei]|uniref:type II secretion system F family protein n=1 Tax=Chitinilyticum litopenaei TaxID=1121276 RepID=UPI000400CD73|nr:type II secretion system F family protein [Chitinilyticum litopenaei]
MPASAPPLPLALRAELFSQLAALETAGLPTDRALASLRLPKPFAERLERMRLAVARGQPLGQAGRQSRLFTPLEAELVGAACAGGSPAATYRQLGEHYALQARLLGQVKARLALPALLVVLGLLLAPIPDVAAGRTGVGGYVLGIIGPLLLLGGLVAGLRWLWRQAQNAPGGGLADALLGLPLLGRWMVRQAQRNFLASLGLLAEAGMPLFDAIPLAVDSIGPASLRRQAGRLLPALKNGATLTQALAKASWLGDERVLALVNTGESSGELAAMLLRLARQLDEELAHTASEVAAWLPRILYALVALWLAANILGSGAFMPRVPAELSGMALPLAHSG